MALPNPSMSFSPFAILTAEEMNDLVENIEALSDGSGLADGSVDATKLSTGAILLGIASATSNFTTTSPGPVLVTGLSVTVTVPDFSRRLLITAYIPTISSATGAPHVGTAQIWDGPVGSGTQLASAALYIAINSNNVNGCVIMAEIAAPSAGSKTYNVGLTIGSTHSKTIAMSATSPGFIKVTAE